VEDHLGDAVVIAQIDEQEMPMVPPAEDPAGQPDGLSHMGLPQLAAGMGAILMHKKV
jgi:hypothetical protein